MYVQHHRGYGVFGPGLRVLNKIRGSTFIGNVLVRGNVS